MKRCVWAKDISDKTMMDYHDNEYGKMIYDNDKMFELLSMEIFQTGLSWKIVLDKRENLNKAFSNFIIGLESVETLKEGATYLAERGIIPSASVWIPMGKPVMGSMKAPGLDYFRKVKELLAELYTKYELTPAGGCGLNVCVEKDIYEYANS